MTNDRTKQWDATTSVATPDWQTTGRTQKAPNPPECSEVKSLRVREGSTLDGPTAGCGKPHVRWCGRVPGRNPRHPTRSRTVRIWGKLSDIWLYRVALTLVCVWIRFPAGPADLKAGRGQDCPTHFASRNPQ